MTPATERARLEAEIAAAIALWDWLMGAGFANECREIEFAAYMVSSGWLAADDK